MVILNAGGDVDKWVPSIPPMINEPRPLTHSGKQYGLKYEEA